MKHTCHIPRCPTEVVPERLMCVHHWKMVPKELQRAVWSQYTKGQCTDTSLVSFEYIQISKQAIDVVQKKEIIK